MPITAYAHPILVSKAFAPHSSHEVAPFGHWGAPAFQKRSARHGLECVIALHVIGIGIRVESISLHEDGLGYDCGSAGVSRSGVTGFLKINELKTPSSYVH